MDWSKYVDYDQTSGTLIWKARDIDGYPSEREMKIFNSKFAGKEAGSKGRTRKRGRSELCERMAGSIKAFKHREYVHRVVWQIHNGEIPEGMIVDHIDGNPWNNRIENLRLATHAENLQNSKKSSNNTSGVKGVVWLKRERKWMAILHSNKKRIVVGYYDTKGLAAVARAKAAMIYHGQYARLA